MDKRREAKSKFQVKGMAAVAETLRLEDFPMDKHGLAYSVGDIEITSTHGRSFPVRLVLDQLTQDEFRSAEEAVRAIRSTLERMPSNSEKAA